MLYQPCSLDVFNEALKIADFSEITEENRFKCSKLFSTSLNYKNSKSNHFQLNNKFQFMLQNRTYPRLNIFLHLICQLFFQPSNSDHVRVQQIESNVKKLLRSTGLSLNWERKFSRFERFWCLWWMWDVLFFLSKRKLKRESLIFSWVCRFWRMDLGIFETFNGKCVV